MLSGQVHCEQHQSEGRGARVPAQSSNCEALRRCCGGHGLWWGRAGEKSDLHANTLRHKHTYLLICVLSHPGHRYRSQAGDLHSRLQTAGHQRGFRSQRHHLWPQHPNHRYWYGGAQQLCCQLHEGHQAHQGDVMLLLLSCRSSYKPRTYAVNHKNTQERRHAVLLSGHLKQKQEGGTEREWGSRTRDLCRSSGPLYINLPPVLFPVWNKLAVLPSLPLTKNKQTHVWSKKRAKNLDWDEVFCSSDFVYVHTNVEKPAAGIKIRVVFVFRRPYQEPGWVGVCPTFPSPSEVWRPSEKLCMQCFSIMLSR